MGEKAVLYAYWLSSCSWRVRAAMCAKRMVFEERNIDIVKKKEQKTEAYRAICPAQKVPALVVVYYRDTPLTRALYERDAVKVNDDDYRKADSCELIQVYTNETTTEYEVNEMRNIEHPPSNGVTLVESMAILQYLEDTRQPALTPSTPVLRAKMREIVETVVAGIQPLQNIGLRPSFDDDASYTKFVRHHTARGLETLEELLARTTREKLYCVGDQLTLADICLVPQVYNAISRHKINISEYPTVSKLYEALLKEEVFVNTHPDKVKLGTSE